jgi:hypothetical protein
MSRLRASFVAVMLLASRPVFACQCGQVPGARDAYYLVSLVATGKVLTIEQQSGPGPFFRRTVILNVERVWKGSPAAKLRLVVGLSDCDYTDFQEGESYIVFADLSKEEPGAWTTSKCRPTKPLKSAGAELQALGTGRLVSLQAQASGRLHLSMESTLKILVLICIAVLLLLLTRNRKPES